MSTIIVDQNQLRSDDLDHRLYYASPEDVFILTDAALVEMMKSDQFESTSFGSLKNLRERSPFIFLGFAVSELMRQELRDKRPTKEIISEELTSEFRLYLVEMTAWGDFGPRHAKTMDLVKTHQAELKLGQLNVAQKRPYLLEAIKEWKQRLSESELKDLRDHKWTDAKWLEKSGLTAAWGVIGMLVKEGWTEDEAKAFCKQVPIIFRFELAFNNLALRWLEWHGIETAPDEKILNDLIDLEYVVLATYCDKFLSVDQKAIELYELLKRLLILAGKPKEAPS